FIALESDARAARRRPNEHPPQNLSVGVGTTRKLRLPGDIRRGAFTPGNHADLILARTTAPNYLGRSVIAWAKEHPSDARSPEALHLTVRATRYGCTNDESRDYSYGAFQLLDKKYPENEWTKKTPFWFR